MINLIKYLIFDMEFDNRKKGRAKTFIVKPEAMM